MDCVNCLFFTNNKAVENKFNFLGMLPGRQNIIGREPVERNFKNLGRSQAADQKNKLFQQVKYYKTVNHSEYYSNMKF